ncbi:hypothetical protein [Caulobacter sp. DWR1-3-2b1]|uniref:hypothetical protein n=1 Tax=Caulobacter sp. DWR1-3-2b1 TaxID=2804670 RepID=UPI003CF550FD
MKPWAPPLAIAALWLAAAGLGAWMSRPSPAPSVETAAPRWLVVKVAAGSPAARDWPHFFACSGLAADPALMRATLGLNGGGAESVWRRDGSDTPIRVALVPIETPSASESDRIIEAATGAIVDCGDTP